jgi:hypothetical protein
MKQSRLARRIDATLIKIMIDCAIHFHPPASVSISVIADHQRELATRRPNGFFSGWECQAAVCFTIGCTSRRTPVSTSKMKPRTGTSFAIQGCDRTLLICSRVFSSGSL